MKNSTLKRAKKIESKVCDALQEFGVFILAKYEFDPFDIFGYSKGKPLLVEVKERRQLWDQLYIEEYKVRKLLKLKNKNNEIGILLAVICNKDCFIYNIEEIAKHKIIKRKVNKTTATGFKDSGKKIEKTLYCFPRTLNNKYLKL